MTTVTTSRIGRQPVAVPTGVNVDIQSEQIVVKGPKGQITVPLQLPTAMQFGRIAQMPYH